MQSRKNFLPAVTSISATRTFLQNRFEGDCQNRKNVNKDICPEIASFNLSGSTRWVVGTQLKKGGGYSSGLVDELERLENNSGKNSVFRNSSSMFLFSLF